MPMDQNDTSQDRQTRSEAGYPRHQPEQSRERLEPEPAVKHNVARQRFELEIAGAAPAFVSYRRNADQLFIEHTFVPEELRGRGIVEKLARGALAEARRQNWKVVSHCSYVAGFMERNREFSDLLVDS